MEYLNSVVALGFGFWGAKLSDRGAKLDRGAYFYRSEQGGVVRSRSEALVGVQGSNIGNFRPFLSCSMGF